MTARQPFVALGMAVVLALAALTSASFGEEDELPSLIPKGKFDGVDLNPNNLVGKPDTKPSEKPAQGGGPQAYTPGYAAENALPEDIVDVVWKMIDTDQNKRATDREAAAAIKPLRVKANSKLASPVRDALRKHANMDDNPVVIEKEAIRLIAKVRAARCPTAARMKAFFDSVDTNGNRAIEGNEITATFIPLGLVGQYLLGQLGPQFKAMDMDKSKSIDLDEASYSANAMLRVQLATEGAGTARRNPRDWYQFVTAVAYLDIDADNKVSRLEASAVRGVAAQFAKIDRNRDQLVSVGELCSFKQKLDLAATSGG